MNLAPYPGHKRTGIEWLGAFPSHWVVKRLRFATERIEQGWSPQCDNQAADDDAWGVMKVGCVNGDQFDASENKALPPELDPKTEYELRPGDVLISRANTRELVGSAAIVPCDVRSKLLLCDKLFRIDLSPEVDAAYLTFCLRTQAARHQYEQEATGASGSMQNIGQDTIKNLILPFPPYSEQQQIAAFLDWKTSQIDALIAKKRTLLEKLKEKRLAVITQAVTKGLNPDVPMRDSGSGWIGQVPSNWDVLKIKFVTELASGHTPSRSVEEYWIDCTIPWVSLNDSKMLREKDAISETHYQISELGLANSSARLLPAGVVVFSRDATVGLCAITEVPMAVSQHFIAYICGEKISGKYLLFVLKAMNQHLQSLQTGSTIVTIGMPEVRSLICPLPTSAEQADIVDHIDSVTARIDQMLANAETAIARLTEYRSALITAATTGKIDVRGWQPLESSP
ncbi:MAG: restriction endonuclease [Burkholderiales bacterium PBB3]|nr:MAG: restriction endonuclease [Burkholderiales bacterium PBB3]